MGPCFRRDDASGEHARKSHRPISLHVGRNVDTELDLADRSDDVIAEQLGEAGVTPVGHVQAVGDHEIFDRDRLLSCQSRITSKRGKKPTWRSSATLPSSFTILLALSPRSGTFGEYCGPTRTRSAPAA